MKKLIQTFITFMMNFQVNSFAAYSYDSFQNALKIVQTNAKDKNYAIVIRRIKNRVNTEKFDKIVFLCDLSDIYKFFKYKLKRKINIIKCDCS